MAEANASNIVHLQTVPVSIRWHIPNTCAVSKPITVAQQLRHQKALRDGTNDQTITSECPVLRCKRRIDFIQSRGDRAKLLNGTVAKRNERERNRVKQVNMGFAALREHVPNGRNNKKMSKVETLRGAMTYIKQLQDMLQTSGSDYTCDNLLENNENDRRNAVLTNLSPSPSRDESSPSQSLGSDSELLSPEEEELLDFVSWF